MNTAGQGSDLRRRLALPSLLAPSTLFSTLPEPLHPHANVAAACFLPNLYTHGENVVQTAFIFLILLSF
jgi:hypothetical protein